MAQMAFDLLIAFSLLFPPHTRLKVCDGYTPNFVEIFLYDKATMSS